MDNINFKLIVVIAISLVTCFFVYGVPQSAPRSKGVTLLGYVRGVEGYAASRPIALAEGHEKMLAPDDYVFLNYSGGDRPINLYIGYYYTASKAYAAHSPLVCYPSQGWKIDTKPVGSTLEVGPHKIHYEEIVTSNQGQKELVLYWYQAGLFTNTQAYKNKIFMGYNKLINRDEQHGFVRVAVPFRGEPYEAVKKTATDFVQAFYPRFVDYIRN
jgi:EpsI family protein